ncbi:MAG: sigma-70 family RNA polymerase sigma factor [Verrucomicrobiae bacterium]|nr:sigma-70 family RNA polymerase sigma factor [Verrucomicrobiae bacterium]
MKSSESAESETQGPPESPVFVTTSWSVVVLAKEKDSPEAARALEQLCRAYWFPLYAHVRRLGRSPADAEDLIQSFFARLLEKDWLAVADRERGRFRSFLLGSLKHFLANEWDKARALKRGGHVRWVSLDAPVGEDRLQHEPVAKGSPDREFDRRWALTLLDAVLGRLEKEYMQAGKAKLFGQLKLSLGSDRAEVNYTQLAGELAMSEGAVRVAVHRLRQHYRELLRDEIAQTVATASEVEDELRQLFQALAG